MKHQEKPVVIVKKRKHKGHGGGHGSWKIAYADFMTAMMAFFLVMWLISIASPSQLAQIADYFRTPLSAAITGGQRLTDSSSPVPGGGDDMTQQHGEVKKGSPPDPDMDELKKSMEKIAEKKRLKKLQGDLDQLIEADPRLRELRPHLRIDLVKQGLRIQIIDSQKRPMFKLGRADVESYMGDILRAIAPVLNSIPNKITISGHTDDLPYANGERHYSNWELSADRANASRRELMAGGLDEGKVLRVVGMSSTMNLSSQLDDALNRRISLVVLNKETEEDILRNNSESEDLSMGAIQGEAAALTQHPPAAQQDTQQNLTAGETKTTEAPQAMPPEQPVQPEDQKTITPDQYPPATQQDTQQDLTTDEAKITEAPQAMLPGQPVQSEDQKAATPAQPSNVVPPQTSAAPAAATIPLSEPGSG